MSSVAVLSFLVSAFPICGYERALFQGSQCLFLAESSLHILSGECGESSSCCVLIKRSPCLPLLSSAGAELHRLQRGTVKLASNRDEDDAEEERFSGLATTEKISVSSLSDVVLSPLLVLSPIANEAKGRFSGVTRDMLPHGIQLSLLLLEGYSSSFCCGLCIGCSVNSPTGRINSLT